MKIFSFQDKFMEFQHYGVKPEQSPWATHVVLVAMDYQAVVVTENVNSHLHL